LIGGILLEINLSGKTKKVEKEVEKEKVSEFSQIADKTKECQIESEERIARGNSLTPMIKDGENVKVLFGYYKCSDVKRNDLVLYNYAGNEAPIIKIAKGIPGDKFSLQETKDGWHILINGEVLKNSEDIPYLVAGKRYEMLSLYEKDYNGVIPQNTYLLLGDQVNGSFDSTVFGLIEKSDILGKAEK
jgi:signal peptidase I